MESKGSAVHGGSALFFLDFILFLLRNYTTASNTREDKDKLLIAHNITMP